MPVKLLEMLSAVVNLLEAGGEAGDDRALGRERRRLLEARDLLLAGLTSPPDLMEVASLVGASSGRPRPS